MQRLCHITATVLRLFSEVGGTDGGRVAGQEVTYQGHAGLGRPVPAPLHLPAKTPPNTDSQPQLIAPKKVRGTPTMYADLQFPKAANSGAMARRGAGPERADYASILYNYNPGAATARL